MLNKPKVSANKKNVAYAIALTLLIIFGFTATLSAVNAHTPSWTIPTYAYVSVSPTTVGVGENALIVMWLDKVPLTAGGTGGDRWRGYMLNITKPDGTKQQLGPITSGQTASAFADYKPDQVGNYTIVFSWPGQTLTNGTGVPVVNGLPYVGDFFMGATSQPVTLHVQAQPIQQWQEPPVPDYWTRPIPTTNRGWAQLASGWLAGSWQRYQNFQESGQGPKSSHILYSKQIINGGISDERYGAVKYDTTDYEDFFHDPIVMSGKIYYNAGTYPNYGYYCVDLRTGEIDWYKNGTDNGLNNPFTLTTNGGGGANGPALTQAFPQLSFGQLYHYYSLNGEGIKDHLWMTVGSTWYMLDANTGNWVLTLKNVPSGTSVTDQDGSILLYNYNANTGKILAWNSSQSIPPSTPTGTGQTQWEPRTGAVIDAVNDTSWTQFGPYDAPATPGSLNTGWDLNDIAPRSGYTMNVTGPKGLPGLSKIVQDERYVPQTMFFSNMRNDPSGYGSSDMFFQAAAVSIDYHVAPYSPAPNNSFTANNNLGYGVTLLWNKTITKPLGGNLTFSLGPISAEEKVFTIFSKETIQWWGYSLADGSLLWGPTAPEGSYEMYGPRAYYAYGKLFSGYMGGVLHTYDIKTGKLLWQYTLTGIGDESPYGNYPVWRAGVAFADGMVYISSSEHSPTQPMWRGAYLRGINTTDGTELWKSLNWVSGSGSVGMVVADGYIVAANQYDNMMYVYGKGPSAATAMAANPVLTLGQQVLITGTVTDQSPGAKDTPAISDKSMDSWMDYLYMKQIKPNNATGVPVHLTAIDPNGNLQDIGTVTSDMKGNYFASWTPPVPGLYKVTATFAGSNSYSSSDAETGFVVSPADSAAPVVTTSPTSTPIASSTPSAIVTPTPTTPTGPGGIPASTVYAISAAVIVIVIVVVAAVALRKRK